MILELAGIRIRPGQNAAFEAAVQNSIATIASRAEGFLGCTVCRGVESPERYLLQVSWRRLEDHTIGFRQSPLYGEWLAVVRPFAAGPAQVEHFETVS